MKHSWWTSSIALLAANILTDDRHNHGVNKNLSENSLSVWLGDEIFCSGNLLMWEGKLLYVAVVW